MSGDKVTYTFLTRMQGELRQPPDPPDNGGMEARVAKLEALIPGLATKEDLLRLESTTKQEGLRLEGKMHQELHALTWRVIGWTTGIAASLVAVTFFVARTVH